jgi:hypothetical protein
MQPGRSDDADHRVLARQLLDGMSGLLLLLPCPPGFPSPARDAFGRRDNNVRTHSSAASNDVHSAR